MTNQPTSSTGLPLPVSSPGPLPQPQPLPPPPGERTLSLRVMTMPKDTNQYGTIFGGVILSLIDQAGFAEARRHGMHRWVTVSVDAVQFKQPVHLGDMVECYTRIERFGTSSVTVAVEVLAQRYFGGQTVEVTTARLTMVSVDETGKAIPFRSEPTVGRS